MTEKELPEWKKRALADPNLPESHWTDLEIGTVESSGSVHSGSNETEILPFPDPWDGDWNDAVINWALWHEDSKRKGEGQEPPEVGETETD